MNICCYLLVSFISFSLSLFHFLFHFHFFLFPFHISYFSFLISLFHFVFSFISFILFYFFSFLLRYRWQISWCNTTISTTTTATRTIHSILIHTTTNIIIAIIQILRHLTFLHNGRWGRR